MDQEDLQGMTRQQFRQFVGDQLAAGEQQFAELHSALAENTEMTKRTAESTAEMVEIFKGAKTGASAFVWLGRNLRKAAQFLYPFALLIGLIAAIVHGKWPKWPE